jgi:hypothetical protein
VRLGSSLFFRKSELEQCFRSACVEGGYGFTQGVAA